MEPMTEDQVRSILVRLDQWATAANGINNAWRSLPRMAQELIEIRASMKTLEVQVERAVDLALSVAMLKAPNKDTHLPPWETKDYYHRESTR